MPNEFKYSPGATAQGYLTRGGFQIGNNTADYGLTFYNGVTPGPSGYTIYVDKAVQGPSIVSPQTDPEFFYWTNALSGQNFTTVPSALEWFNTQTGIVCVNKDYEPISLNGLIFNFDAGYTPCWPKKVTVLGTTGNNVASSYDTSGLNALFSSNLTGVPTYSPDNGGIFLGTLLYFGSDNFSTPVILRNWWNSPTRTLQTWARLTPITVTTSTYQFFYFSDGGDPGTEGGYVLNLGRLGITGALVPVTLTANVWYHIVWVRTGPATESLYLNGTFAGTLGTSTNVPPQGINTYFSGALLINSAIDWSNLQLYNRALSASEILGNYNAMKSRFGL